MATIARLLVQHIRSCHQSSKQTHVRLVSLSQVVRKVLLDVLDKVLGVFRVKVQHFVQPLQVDALQVAVGQGFHVRVGFYHAVV